MFEFIQENPLLWDITLIDYRRTDKKKKLWEEQAVKLKQKSYVIKIQGPTARSRTAGNMFSIKCP